MRKKLNQPWLTVSEVERPTEELKEISKSWDEQTWGEYLNWFETGRKDKLVSPVLYDSIADSIEKNVFEELEQKNCPNLRSYCDQLLTELPKHQEFILRSIFFEGKTQSQIAVELNRTKTCIRQNKFKALTRLKREYDGEILSARRIVEGVEVFIPEIEDSIWDEKLSDQICDHRPYGISDHDKDLLGHKCPELREAFRELSERSRQVNYLKFWCGLKNYQIARKCSIGVNTVETIIEATVFKIKSKIVENLTADKSAF